jgi:hypothetical protein
VCRQRVAVLDDLSKISGDSMDKALLLVAYFFCAWFWAWIANLVLIFMSAPIINTLESKSVLFAPNSRSVRVLAYGIKIISLACGILITVWISNLPSGSPRGDDEPDDPPQYEEHY